MPVNIEEKIEKLSAERREKVEARAKELIAEEISLRDLRKAMGKTQVAMAKKLGLKQENVSRVEKRTDMLLSTLNLYLRALGGRLRLVAEFKDRGAISIAGLAAIKPSKKAVRAPVASRLHEPLRSAEKTNNALRRVPATRARNSATAAKPRAAKR